MQFCKRLLITAIFILTISGFDKCAFSAYPDLIQDGKIHPAIEEIAKIIAPHEALPSDSDLEAWNNFLQKNFLRPPGDDHQEAQKASQHARHSDLLPHFKVLGLIDAIRPGKQEFDVIVIFGGTPWDTAERFFWTNHLIADGIKTKGFMYINGKRILKSSELEWLKCRGFEGVTYQHESAQTLWDSSDLKKFPITILTVDPPAERRANTEDTLKAFLTYAKDHGIRNALFITNGPYGPYQFETALHIIKGELQFEGSSSTTKSDISTISLTDTIARRFYTIVQNMRTRSS